MTKTKCSHYLVDMGDGYRLRWCTECKELIRLCENCLTAEGVHVEHNPPSAGGDAWFCDGCFIPPSPVATLPGYQWDPDDRRAIPRLDEHAIAVFRARAGR